MVGLTKTFAIGLIAIAAQLTVSVNGAEQQQKNNLSLDQIMKIPVAKWDQSILQDLKKAIGSSLLNLIDSGLPEQRNSILNLHYTLSYTLNKNSLKEKLQNNKTQLKGSLTLEKRQSIETTCESLYSS